MEGNPFAAFWGEVRQDAGERLPVGHRMGRVTQRSPLRLDVDGLPIEAPELQISHALRGGLEAGDTVLLLDTTGDGQRFIVLCKVVGA